MPSILLMHCESFLNTMTMQFLIQVMTEEVANRYLSLVPDEIAAVEENETSIEASNETSFDQINCQNVDNFIMVNETLLSIS